MNKAELTAYLAEVYGAEPEYLWEDFPTTFIFRHNSNRKWFAAVMEVSREKLGLSGPGTVDVVNVKCGPLLSGSYRAQPGVLPAWHMNKDHWLTLLLDETAADQTIKELLQISYDLTNVKKRPKSGKDE